MLITITLLFKLFLLNHYSSAEWVDMPQFSDEQKIYRITNIKQDHFYKFAEKNVDNQFIYTRETSATLESPNNIKNTWLESNTTESSYVETIIPPTIENAEKNEQCSDTVFTSNNTDFFKYLPVDLLKSVHRTLKSHKSTSSRGKMQFLKTFENTLISEIESRLTKATTIVRQKRGAEHHGYDHGYDHESATGFPSIEGALMAISFLTFAVYLVRLVMFLFRNINNPTPTTTGATLLIGKRKRSITKFDDDMTMFLQGLHSFSSTKL